MTQQSHSWAHIWRKTQFKKIHVSPMFIVALFTTAMTGEQPRCPSTGEWINVMWYIYTMYSILYNIAQS